MPVNRSKPAPAFPSILSITSEVEGKESLSRFLSILSITSGVPMFGFYLDNQEQKLLRKLSRLPASVQNRVMRRALAKGGKVVKAQAKKNAPKDSGDLRKGIKLKRAKKVTRKGWSIKADKLVTEYKLAASPFGNYQGDTYYGGMVEYGHEYITPQGATGSVKGEYFMERAYEEKGEQAKEVIIKEIQTGLDEIIKTKGQ